MEELESGQSAVEAEKKITALEATIKELEAVRDAEKLQAKTQLEYADAQFKELQSALQTTKEEISRIQDRIAVLRGGDFLAKVKFGLIGHGF